MGENPLRSIPQPDRVLKALEKIEFIVVQDILEGETTRVADIVLPGAAFSEKEGSFINLEGRLQTFLPAVTPPGEAKADLEILGLIAEKMRPGESYGSLEKIREEINQGIPIYSKVGGNGQTIFTKNIEKNFDEKGNFVSFSSLFSPKDESKNADYPFTAILLDLHYHLGSGTRTIHSNRISKIDCKGEIEISSQDGEKLGLQDGSLVRVFSPYGSIEREIRIEKESSAGLIFIPLAVRGNDAMKLIQLNDISASNPNSWNTCRVKVEKV